MRLDPDPQKNNTNPEHFEADLFLSVVTKFKIRKKFAPHIQVLYWLSTTDYRMYPIFSEPKLLPDRCPPWTTSNWHRRDFTEHCKLHWSPPKEVRRRTLQLSLAKVETRTFAFLESDPLKPQIWKELQEWVGEYFDTPPPLIRNTVPLETTTQQPWWLLAAVIWLYALNISKQQQ